ncbi:MAG TPA: peptide ABC transporter substrate-binding protein [Candidatus Limnocylindrales bacterium]|nr:peptide ABC transporter substrate-binding protein [Candidatus Limnocylindrales bacterium]
MLRIGVCAALTALLLGACNDATSPVVPKPTGLASDQTLRFPIQHDVSTLDPAMIDTEAEAEIAHNLFDGLLKYDSNLNISPDIAASMPTISADGLTYTFKLRTDVTFSNGDKVTSQDVLYSWNRAAAMQGPYAVNLSAIAGYDHVASNTASGGALESLLEKGDPSVTMFGLTAPDASTVVVNLTGAAGWFNAAIAQPAVAGMIVDQNVVKSNFEGWWSKPETLIGTGAYGMSAHVADQSLDFSAIPAWWGTPKPTLNNVHVDVVIGASSALARYEKGSFDLFGYAAYGPAAADVARIQSDASEQTQLVLEVKNKTYFVTFNLAADPRRPAGGPFTGDRGKPAHDLRLAFTLAVDRTRLAKELCANIACIPATGGVIPKGLAGYLGDNNDPLATFDPEKARSLLQSADPNGTRTKNLTYTYDPESPFNEPTATFLQSQWQANLGVKVALQAIPHTRFVTERLRGTYVLSRDGWSADYNHPQDWFDNLWGQAAGCPDTTCSSGYDTSAYDQLLGKADTEPLSIAIPDYKALSRQLIDDVVYLPLFYTVDPFLFKPYVLGAGSNNMFDYYWNQIQISAH